MPLRKFTPRTEPRPSGSARSTVPTLVFFLLWTLPLSAHVGSPDVFYEGNAGPYRLLVTLRPPVVVPGIAEVEIRALSPGIDRIRIAPMRLVTQRQYSPVPDIAQRSKDDPQFYTGALWLMGTGEWKVIVQVEGKDGPGSMAVPVPALSSRVLGVPKTLAFVMTALGLVLVFGLAAIAAASVREAQLPPGVTPSAARRRLSGIVMAGALLVAGGVLWAGDTWWNADAADYGRIIFKPLQLNAAVEGNRLTLRLQDPGWLNRRMDDLLPDHGHLMHLFIVNLPQIDQVWHLHPDRGTEPETFTQQLPDMAPGRYALYGDIVHANGIAETVTAQLDLPAIKGVELAGDDAAGGPPIVRGAIKPDVSELPGGYRMLWEHSGPSIHARQPYQFRFRVQDLKGADATDMELYMGMQGHAAFLKDDGSVFVHVHPSGSVPAATLGLLDPAGPHAGHDLPKTVLPAQLAFPYGLPKPGIYRLFVQVKRGGKIMTGAFNANVEK